jgi:hypothetical protein
MKTYRYIRITGKAGDQQSEVDISGFDYNICFNIIQRMWSEKYVTLHNDKCNYRKCNHYEFHNMIYPTDFFNLPYLFLTFDYKSIETLLSKWKYWENYKQYEDLKQNYKKYIDEAIIKSIIE